MYRILRYCIFFSCVFFLFGCKKSTDLVIKYEVVTTVPISSKATIPTNVSAPFPVNNTFEFLSGSTWSETVPVSTSYRPMSIHMNAQTIYLSGPGSATCNIYINGSLKATVTTASTFQGGKDQVFNPPLSHTLN